MQRADLAAMTAADLFRLDGMGRCGVQHSADRRSRHGLQLGDSLRTGRPERNVPISETA